MARTSTFPLVDRILDGQLRQRLNEWRSAGDSFETMAFRLRDLGFAVSASTVRRWCEQELDEVAS